MVVSKGYLIRYAGWVVFLLLTIIFVGQLKESESSTLTVVKVKGRKKPLFLYVTFDDGPNAGTETVLDAFKEVDGEGTFFVNCLRFCACEFNLPEIYYSKGNCTVGRAALQRMVREGHVLGDHSSDHMAHNHVGQGYHYLSPEDDLPYFNEANIAPTAQFLQHSGLSSHIKRVRATMTAVKRLPFTDVWNVRNGSTRGSTPALLGPAGKVAAALSAQGADVFGWDIQWGYSDRHKKGKMREAVGVAGMLSQLKPRAGRIPGKLVLLSHDYLHIRPDEDMTMHPGSRELAQFLKGAIKRGWTLRTLDTYLTD